MLVSKSLPVLLLLGFTFCQFRLAGINGAQPSGKTGKTKIELFLLYDRFGLWPSTSNYLPYSEATNILNSALLYAFTRENQQTVNNSSNLTNCEKRQKETSSQSSVIGFIAAAVAILMFGSNFVPVKKITTGDGIFFQWIVCFGIWFVGLIIHLYNGAERKFFPLAMVGGAIWCTGNMCVVPVIKTIGLAMGLLIWGLLNLIAGWATGRFGTFGLTCEQPVSKSALNFVGVACAMLSLAIFLFVKSEEPRKEKRRESEDVIGKLENSTNVRYENINNEENAHLLSDQKKDQDDSSWLDNLTANQKRIVGVSLSIISGIMYGINFVPMYYIQKSDENAPDKGLEYVFSQFCGIFMTSSIYFLIYCLYKRNKPDVFPSTVAPGFLSGVLWAIGDVSWFIANTNLSEPISFPIVTTGPGIVASVWGILVFKEIKGVRNFVTLGVAFCFSISGAIITGFSK